MTWQCALVKDRQEEESKKGQESDGSFEKQKLRERSEKNRKEKKKGGERVENKDSDR